MVCLPSLSNKLKISLAKMGNLFFTRYFLHFKPKIKEFKTSFHLVNKLIIVKAEINDESGWFILDTGLPDLILNKHHFCGKGKQFNFREIHGNDVSASKITIDFQFEGIKLKGREVMALDLKHLEKKTKIPIKGMIGQKLLRKYELLLDYEQRTITFFRLNRKGNKLATTLMPNYAPSDTLSFSWKCHLPVVKMKWGGNLLRFGLDTGAGINLVTPKQANLLVNSGYKVVKVKLLNMDAPKKAVPRKFINSAKLGNHILLPMKTISCDFGAINASLAGKDLDGILGYEFFKQQKVSINFKQKKLYLWSKPIIQNQTLAQKGEE